MPCRASRLNRWRNISATSGSSSTTRMLKLINSSLRLCPPRQVDRELGELAEHAVDLDRSAMLLRYNVIADRQPQPGALTGRFGCKERLEQLGAEFWRNSGAIVVHPDLDRLAEILRCDLQHRVPTHLPALLGRGIKAVAEQV